jgi:hypothetical protein
MEEIYIMTNTFRGIKVKYTEGVGKKEQNWGKNG